MSKHILDLEDELGSELFVRRGKRLTGLTEPGKELVGIVDRMLIDARNIKRLSEQFANRDEGSLTVATTHTQARHALPQVVRRFEAAYLKVQLALHPASPAEIVAMLQSGEADIGIATESLDGGTAFASFPFNAARRVASVPGQHHPDRGAPRPLFARLCLPLHRGVLAGAHPGGRPGGAGRGGSRGWNDASGRSSAGSGYPCRAGCRTEAVPRRVESGVLPDAARLRRRESPSSAGRGARLQCAPCNGTVMVLAGRG